MTGSNTPPAQNLRADEAQIWQVDLRSGTGGAPERMLSAQELARAARFVFERDRRRFVVGRAALRSLLADYLQCGPQEVELLATEHGRPLCPALTGRLDFNLSNSGDIAIIALTPDAPVGVDVECLRPIPDSLDLSRHYFSGSETDSLQHLSDAARHRAFLTCWTRKEAVLKAIGLGLYLEPASVLTDTLEHPMKVPTPYGAFEIRTFAIGNDAVATLATPHVMKRLHMHTFRPFTADLENK